MDPIIHRKYMWLIKFDVDINEILRLYNKTAKGIEINPSVEVVRFIGKYYNKKSNGS